MLVPNIDVTLLINVNIFLLLIFPRTDEYTQHGGKLHIVFYMCLLVVRNYTFDCCVYWLYYVSVKWHIYHYSILSQKLCVIYVKILKLYVVVFVVPYCETFEALIHLITFELIQK